MPDKKLLTKQEEITLGTWIQRWIKERSTRACNSYTRKKGRAAREKLILSNLRLVQKIAQRYKNNGLDLEDLISEGNIGLVRAVEKFDPNKGSRFSTYATYWIRQSMTRALSNQSRVIRLPTHAVEKQSKIVKFVAKYKEDNGVEPSLEEICEATKASKKLAKALLESGVTNIVSLDSEIGEDENGSTLKDLVEGDAFVPPDMGAESNENIQNMLDFINRLSRREKYILIYRYGLNNKDSETLETLACKYGLSRERIRQIQILATEKLKKSTQKHYRKAYPWETNKKALKLSLKNLKKSLTGD